jgi:hypothetical protein
MNKDSFILDFVRITIVRTKAKNIKIRAYNSTTKQNNFFTKNLVQR